MSDGKVWFITGAGRGMGADFAKAVLSTGHGLVAPRRFLAGADAIATAEQKIADLRSDIESNRQLSASLAFDS